MFIFARYSWGQLLTYSFLLGTLLSCSHAAPDTPVATATAKPRSFGTRVDSLNGVPGHHFGEPLSAFPGLVKLEQAGRDQVTYNSPVGDPNPRSWFARHYAEVSGQFFIFQDGKFSTFRAIAYSPAGQTALEQEARFLFGPGRELGPRTEWAGEQADAILQTTFLNGRQIKELDVNSRTARDELARREQARLQAENAQ